MTNMHSEREKDLNQWLLNIGIGAMQPAEGATAVMYKVYFFFYKCFKEKYSELHLHLDSER